VLRVLDVRVSIERMGCRIRGRARSNLSSNEPLPAHASLVRRRPWRRGTAEEQNCNGDHTEAERRICAAARRKPRSRRSYPSRAANRRKWMFVLVSPDSGPKTLKTVLADFLHHLLLLSPELVDFRKKKYQNRY
jgi:hypothetical protein